MKKSFVYYVASAFVLMGLWGCACNRPSIMSENIAPELIETDAYKAKVDSFVVILDASSSMDACDQGSRRMDRAKAIVGNFNQALPEMAMSSTLLSFGHSPSVSEDKYAFWYGPAAYSTVDFQNGLDKIVKAGGTSPMAVALEATGETLASNQGNVAMILVSDGKEIGAEAVETAKKIKAQFGERLCIYTIHVGHDADGKALLDKIAQAGGCGYATSDSELASGQAMAAFVTDVFLEERMDADMDGIYDDQDNCLNTPSGVSVDANGCPVDTDGDGIADHLDQCGNTPSDVMVDDKGCPLDKDQDGVADYLDKCPNTGKAVKVDADGCPVDSDGDGIMDYMDNCPDTPQGTAVDTSGCPLPQSTESAQVTEAGTWLYQDIQYSTGSAEIKPGSFAVLDEIAQFLTNNPSTRVEIQGHTDSAGSAEGNMKLSKARAESVKDYLLRKGVSSDQVSTQGFGSSRPITSNATAEGRTKNRRVELKPVK